MNWKKTLITCASVISTITLLIILVVRLLSEAHINLRFYGEANPLPIVVVTCVVLGLTGLITYLVFRKPRSTPKL